MGSPSTGASGMGMGHPGWALGILGQGWSTLVGIENTGNGFGEPRLCTGNHGTRLEHPGWALGTLGGDRVP